MGKTPEGRALTYEEKREVVDKVLGAWMCSPALRLGQLLNNTLTELLVEAGVKCDNENVGRRLFYIEDQDLAKGVTRYVIRDILKE